MGKCWAEGATGNSCKGAAGNPLISSSGLCLYNSQVRGFGFPSVSGLALSNLEEEERTPLGTLRVLWYHHFVFTPALHQRSRSNYTQLFIMSNTDWTPCWCQKKRDTAMALLFCIPWLVGKVVWVLTHLLHALVPPQSTNGTSSDHRVFPQAQKYIRVPMGIPLLCNVVWWKSLWEVRIIHNNIGVTSKDMSK